MKGATNRFRNRKISRFTEFIAHMYQPTAFAPKGFQLSPSLALNIPNAMGLALVNHPIVINGVHGLRQTGNRTHS
jgi:hypothetical protein